MKRALSLLAALLAVGLALCFEIERVPDEDMAPSLLRGDWVLVGPGTPRAGDVVLLPDPLDPDRRVLRRVLGLAGAKVRIEAGALKIDGDGSRLREMGRGEGFVVYSESNGWLIRSLDRGLRPPPLAVTVADDALWLMADDRDQAVDSRWWGARPADAVDGVVWLRVGSSDAWRGHLTWRGVDGPWLPPSKRGDAG